LADSLQWIGQQYSTIDDEPAADNRTGTDETAADHPAAIHGAAY
jgi:hypothetical protein